METRATGVPVMAFPEPSDLAMLHSVTGLLLPTPGVRETQGVAFYLRKFFFSGSRLCQGMSPSSSGDSYRRVYSSRLPFKAQFGSVDILVGQEDVQAHFGSFQASTKLCLYWGLL